MPVLTDEIRNNIRELLPRYPRKQAVTLPALHLVQQHFHCVPLAAIEEIAELLDLHPAEVHDTLTFYGFFRDEKNPLGRHRVWVCRSLPCMLRGGEAVLRHLCEKLATEPGTTTADGRVSVEAAECLGACEVAPCMLVDEAVEGNLTPEQAEHVLERLD